MGNTSLCSIPCWLARGMQQRQWAIEQLCGVLKQAAAAAEVKQQVLRFLTVHALFSIDAAAAKKVCLAAGQGAVARAGFCMLNLHPGGQPLLCATCPAYSFESHAASVA